MEEWKGSSMTGCKRGEGTKEKYETPVQSKVNTRQSKEGNRRKREK